MIIGYTCENMHHAFTLTAHLVHLHTGGVGKETEVLTDSLADLVQVLRRQTHMLWVQCYDVM